MELRLLVDLAPSKNTGLSRKSEVVSCTAITASLAPATPGSSFIRQRYGGPKVKALFTRLTKMSNGVTTTLTTSGLRQNARGVSTIGQAFDGIFAP
ncbi:MAG TPA: hypothetical protein VM580_13755 [Labilithrix sp.]|nr:hypothetical protein [Labilithrix sp.]